MTDNIKATRILRMSKHLMSQHYEAEMQHLQLLLEKGLRTRNMRHIREALHYINKRGKRIKR